MLLLGSGITLLLQWNVVTKLRRENQSLREAADGAQKVRDGSAELTRTQSAIEQNRQSVSEDRKDLLRLRNEVTRLREQTKELEQLRAANQSLHTKLWKQDLPTTNQAVLDEWATQQWENMEVDDSMAAVYALVAIRLIEAGENEKAMQKLVMPIGMYYRLYKKRASTEERSKLLDRIDQAAKNSPVIARELERKIE